MLRRFLMVGIWLIPMQLAFSQSKLQIEKGTIKFTSNAELEVIQATSEKLQGLFDVQSNKFAFSVEIPSFKGFNSALQREHFNEKYLESDKFPKATFTGKIIEEVDMLKNGTYEVRAKGELEIHGIKQTRIIKGKITVANGKVSIDAKFFVPLSEHNITIPQIVHQKIATEIEVTISASLASRQ